MEEQVWKSFCCLPQVAYVSTREPLSNVPVDLLFLHLVLPYTVHYFRPKKAIKEVATVVWKFLATRLRLTSYFFGDRHPQEEFTPKDWRDNFIRSGTFVANADTPPDGSFRRVPATDNLALPRDMRATVAVTADGEPVDDAARALMILQNAEAEKAKHNIQEDYTIVYIPPNFRSRVIAFITMLWMIGAICVGFVVALPLSLGRSFFRLFTPRDIHDGYSFIIGFYLIWLCYLIAHAIDRLDRRRKRRSGEGPRAELGLLVVKRGLLWFAKMIYMAFFLGIAIPILLAVVVDLYIVLPIRFAVDPALVPKIKIVDQWALGLLYAKIAIYVQRIQPPTRISRGLQQVCRLILPSLRRNSNLLNVDTGARMDASRPRFGDEGSYCPASWRAGWHDNYPWSRLQGCNVLFFRSSSRQSVHMYVVFFKSILVLSNY